MLFGLLEQMMDQPCDDETLLFFSSSMRMTSLFSMMTSGKPPSVPALHIVSASATTLSSSSGWLGWKSESQELTWVPL